MDANVSLVLLLWAYQAPVSCLTWKVRPLCLLHSAVLLHDAVHWYLRPQERSFFMCEAGIMQPAGSNRDTVSGTHGSLETELCYV